MKTTKTTEVTTLQTLILSAKCRKGAAAGTTKKGACWLACEPITIRRSGGDGIGNSGPDCTTYLQLRHFRDGSIAATVNYNSWHQNHGMSNSYQAAPEVLAAQSIEEVIAALKGTGYDGQPAISNYFADDGDTFAALSALGLPQALPSPDDTAAATAAA